MEFQPFRSLIYNTNTKGGDLEEIVMSFFNDYLDSFGSMATKWT
jgi:hypothetical protein